MTDKRPLTTVRAPQRSHSGQSQQSPCADVAARAAYRSRKAIVKDAQRHHKSEGRLLRVGQGRRRRRRVAGGAARGREDDGACGRPSRRGSSCWALMLWNYRWPSTSQYVSVDADPVLRNTADEVALASLLISGVAPHDLAASPWPPLSRPGPPLRGLLLGLFRFLAELARLPFFRRVTKVARSLLLLLLLLCRRRERRRPAPAAAGAGAPRRAR